MENFDNEQWRDIAGYEGMYQVSDLGRVRSLKYGKVRVLKPGKNRGGYLSVLLYKDRKHNRLYVHRLVAQAFIPNDDDTKIYINHINEDKTENKVSNIEWCDYQYNNTYNDIHRRRKQYIHHQPKRSKIKELYRPDLSVDDNIKLFKSNGIWCCAKTVIRLRKDLGLTKHYRPRKKAN